MDIATMLENFKLSGNLSNDVAPTKEKQEEVARRFELFPKLPVELRLKIWNLAFSGRQYPLILQNIQMVAAYGPKGRYTIPLLTVCREARTELIKHYPKIIHDISCVILPLRFNYSLDAVILFPRSGNEERLREMRQQIQSPSIMPRLLPDMDLTAITSVAVAIGEYRSFFSGKGADLAEFTSLRLLTLLVICKTADRVDSADEIPEPWYFGPPTPNLSYIKGDHYRRLEETCKKRYQFKAAKRDIKRYKKKYPERMPPSLVVQAVRKQSKDSMKIFEQ